MSLAMTITKLVADGQQCRVSFNLTPVGNYVTAVGGDTVDFTKATQDTAFVGMVPGFIPSDQGPVSFDVWDVSGNLATLITPTMGTTQANSKVQIQTAVNTEKGSGAYPSPMKLQGEAVFNKYV